jgi:undecaprenyl-diphosphatase
MVSDYLVPVVFSVVLLGLWFGWADQAMRERHQRGVMLAGIGVGIANVMVKISNAFYFRPRPFDSIDVELLFYPPTDSSFPANPIAITVAMATGVWMANKRMGAIMYMVAFIYGFSRVYSGVFYPLDILGGALIGLSASYLVYFVLKRIEPVPTLCLRLVRFLCVA